MWMWRGGKCDWAERKKGEKGGDDNGMIGRVAETLPTVLCIETIDLYLFHLTKR